MHETTNPAAGARPRDAVRARPAGVADQVSARRRDGLVVRELGDETVVLDMRSDAAHHLPADVTRVWNACAAGRTVADVARAAGVDADHARRCIAELAERDLIVAPEAGPARRTFLRRSALVGAALVAGPAIQTVLAPTAYAACSTTHITLAQGGQDTCTGTSAHAKYTVTVQGCDANTTYYPLLEYRDDTGTTVVEVAKTLQTDATGFATSGPGQSVTNSRLLAGSQPVSLTLYLNSAHSQPVPGGAVTVLFTIVC